MKPTIYILLFCLFGYCLPAHSQTKAKRETLHNLKTSYKDFRFSVGGGYAYRMGKVDMTGDSQLDQLSKDLRNGFNLDIDAQYYFKESWGLGLNINYARASASADNIYISGIGYAPHLKEVNNFTYIGPTFSWRHSVNKFLFTINTGFGPLFFKSKDIINNGESSFVFNKTAFAVQINLNAEYSVTENVGVGLKLGVIAGNISVENYDERLNVSNLGMGAFISFKNWE